MQAAIPVTPPKWLAFAGVVVLLLLVWACYWPGLSGGFLFDDFVNLDALGKRGPIDNWQALWRYLTSGTADPLGRPLALLSFLIDARDWPAAPYPFLRTNLALHGMNGVLLFLLLQRLEKLLGARGYRRFGTALLGTALWLLHPLLVSTTLYVVQREAMLPATITLLALHLFLAGRQRYLDSKGDTGAWAMLLAIVLGTPLAMLCKANGILLPLLAWAIVAAIGARGSECLPTSACSRLRRLDLALLALPSLLLFAYLAQYLTHLNADIAQRPWTIGQRLLTQPRVLIEYLWLLIVPKSMSAGLFNDEYIVSADWRHPWTTLPAMLAVLVLLGVALRWRSTHPRLSASLLFYFAGQLLESTVVPLELYFEHRNYLPAMLLFWPLAHALAQWRLGRWKRIAVAVLLVGICASSTAQRAHLWGEPEALATTWSTLNPDSPRAVANAALTLLQSGDDRQALALLLPAWKKRPNEVQLAFNTVNALCLGPGLTPATVGQVDTTLRLANSGNLLIHQWLGRALAVAAGGDCRGLTMGAIERWTRTALANPRLGTAATRSEDFEPLLGELAIQRGEGNVALTHFRHALEVNPTPDFAARLVTSLAANQQPEAALALLDDYERRLYRRRGKGFGMAWLHEQVMIAQGFWPHEFAVLREKLRHEIATRQPR